MTALPDISTLLPWTEPRRVPTSAGPRLLRTAPAPQTTAWRDFWRANKQALRDAGLSWPPGDNNAFAEIKWWQPLPEAERAAEAVTMEASRATDADIDIPTPPGLELFPFQKAGVKFACTVWGHRFDGPRLVDEPLPPAKRGCLIGDAMGLGKTLQAIGAINCLAKIQRVLVISPATAKYNWLRELRKWLVRSMSIGVAEGKTFPTTDIVIINPEILHNFGRSLSNYWDLIVIDEAHRFCFVAGTKVQTEKGPKPIEKINIGERVLSCRLSTGMLEYKYVTGTHQAAFYDDIIRVHHQHGHFDCTADHEVWVLDSTAGLGWKKARALTNRDRVWVLPRQGDEAEHGHQMDCQVLQQFVRFKVEDAATGNQAKASKQPHKTSDKRMSVVQKTIHLPQQREKQRQKEVLQPVMLGKRHRQRPGNDEKTDQRHECRLGGQETREVTGISHADDPCQSDAKPGNQTQDGQRSKGQNLSGQGRQRAANQAADHAGRGIAVADGSGDCNCTGGGKIREPAVLLQGGHWKRGAKSSGGSGRENASPTQVEVSGPPQNGNLKSSRVVRIEVLKPVYPYKPFGSDATDTVVYCLEVEDNHNFFANGTLVSNCNPKTRQAKCLFGHRPSRKEKAEGKTATSGIPARRKLALTGTPIVNRVMDFFPILNYLDPQTWDNAFKFGLRYAAGHQKRIGRDRPEDNQPELPGQPPKRKRPTVVWDFKGSSNLDELQTRLRSTIMVRRLKHEVLPDLPPKLYRVVELPNDPASEHSADQELDLWESRYGEKMARLAAAVELAKASPNKEDYHRAVQALDEGTSVAFKEMSLVRHRTAMAKLPACLDYVRAIFEEDPAHKLIIFCHHLDVVKACKAQWPNAPTVVGGMDARDRMREVDRFQNDPSATPFLGGLRAASEAITLTAASHVIFFELDWTPGKMAQAADRAHRIGQKDSVLVEYLVLANSLDCHVAYTLVAKEQIIDQCLDSQERESLGAEVVVPKVN